MEEKKNYLSKENFCNISKLFRDYVVKVKVSIVDKSQLYTYACSTPIKRRYDISSKGDGSIVLYFTPCTDISIENKEYVLNIISDDVIYLPKKCSFLFSVLDNVKSFDGLENINTSNVVDMASMFECCYELENLDLAGWNVDGVQDTSGMFFFCEKLEQLNIDGWNLPYNANMFYMFKECPEKLIQENEKVKELIEIQRPRDEIMDTLLYKIPIDFILRSTGCSSLDEVDELFDGSIFRLSVENYERALPIVREYEEQYEKRKEDVKWKKRRII